MGYTTEFVGTFNLNKKLTPELKTFLDKLADTRRMGRNMDEDTYGVQGEFYVGGGGFAGQERDSNIVDYNTPPRTQPGLWLKWVPTPDGMGLEWNGYEKFYSYGEWMVYLIEKILKPNGYVVNGSVKYSGEDVGDVGRLTVEDNVVYLRPYEGEEVKYGTTFQNYEYPTGYVERSIKPEIAYPLVDVVNPEENADKDTKFLIMVRDLIQGGMIDGAVNTLQKKIDENLVVSK